jgi:hypothetical protein
MNQQHFTEEQESVFAAMRRQIALTAMPDPQPATLRERMASHPRLAVGGAGAVVAAAAATLATGAFTSAPPAFAVTTTRDSVTITLNDVGALNSLNARLAAENIPIRAVPVVAGCTATAQEANGPAGASQTLEAGSPSGPIGSMTIVLLQRPAPGYTIVVGLSSGGPLDAGPAQDRGTSAQLCGRVHHLTPKAPATPAQPTSHVSRQRAVQLRWQASDRSRETCSTAGTSNSGTTPTSLPCAEREALVRVLVCRLLGTVRRNAASRPREFGAEVLVGAARPRGGC